MAETRNRRAQPRKAKAPEAELPEILIPEETEQPEQAELPEMPVAAPEPEFASSEAQEPAFLKALDDLSIPDLNAVLAKAARLKSAKIDDARQDFMMRMRRESEQLGLDLGTLFAASGPKRGRKPKGENAERTRAPAPVKYRSPEGAEWSGRGRTPQWLQAAEAGGRNREEFLADRRDESEAAE